MAEVRVEIDGHVAILSLDAPDRRNALTPAMAAELIAACEELDANPDVGAVVVRGEGGYFCAGAHRDTLANVGAVYDSFVRVGQLEAPTVAAVRGGAVGAGANLALATDLRVVAEDARLTAGFLRIGLHPGGGFFTLALRGAGREAAAALGLFGETIDGRRAAALGLAWDAVPDGTVDDRARELARIAGSDPALARRTARTFRLELGPPTVPWAAALEAERAAQMWSLRRRAADVSAAGG
jgi:enoyl-CoA hydratase